MSGLEVIGSIASITQLCEYIIKGVSSAKATFKEFEDLPQTIADRTRYLDSLASILQSISNNKSLQSKEILPYLEAINQHIDSLNTVLAENLRRVQHKSIKSFTHLFRKRESDRDAINEALVNLEHDKSNLSLFMLNKFGESVSQIVNMSNVKTLADLNKGAATASQSGSQTGQRLGSANDVQQPQRTTAASADKRKWKGLKVSGDKANMTCGDINADAETIRARKEAGDDREWEELEVEGNEAVGMFGDKNELKT